MKDSFKNENKHNQHQADEFSLLCWSLFTQLVNLLFCNDNHDNNLGKRSGKVSKGFQRRMCLENDKFNFKVIVK